MVKIDDLQKYKIYLMYLNKKLGEYFKEQAPYIFCKAGCSSCCEKGEYPFTEIEFAYLMLGIQNLDKKTLEIIEKNIELISIQKNNHDDLKKTEKFLYKCPFLIDKKCSLYEYRGIICRSHGLAFFNKGEKVLVPACVDEGLNYSNVYDFENRTISSEKYKNTGIAQEPLAHNIGVNYLTKNEITQMIGLDFGEIKPMYEFFLKKVE